MPQRPELWRCETCCRLVMCAECQKPVPRHRYSADYQHQQDAVWKCPECECREGKRPSPSAAAEMLEEPDAVEIETMSMPSENSSMLEEPCDGERMM